MDVIAIFLKQLDKLLKENALIKENILYKPN
jgi:hypothetical protein